MKNALFALVLLAPMLANADDGRSRPYVLNNGRSAGTAAATASRAAVQAAVQASAPRSTAVSAQRVASGVNSVSANSGTQAMVGQRATGGRPSGHKSFWTGSRKAEPAPTPAEDVPTYFTKPGAFIRSEGQQPKYEEASAARTHTVEGGSFIDINDRKANDVGRSGGLRLGPKDTPPPPNPGSTTGSGGGSSITPNSTINITNNTTNGNQNGGSGNGNGHGNGDGFGGGTGFDPAF